MPRTLKERETAAVDVRNFDLPVAVTLRLQARSGRVHVIAEPRDDVRAEGDDLRPSEEDGGATLQIRAGRGAGPLTVRCPLGTDVTVGTQSGDVRMDGQFGDVSVTTMSGKIELEAADDADLRTMSADVYVGACAGRCRVSSISGKVVGGDADAATVSTMSGSIKFDRVSGEFRARSVSGTVECNCLGAGAIAVKTVSGKVHLTLPDGTQPDTCCKSMSGNVRCTLPEGDDVRVEAMSVSGSIEVEGA